MNEQTAKTGDQIPLAVVYGKPLIETPRALYIPPTALRVLLDEFVGPLDLLLYLVRRHQFDILDIPMAELCRQYARFMEAIVRDNLEIAADYLTMSALLMEIKSKMLLPAPSSEEDEADPRADLVHQLLVYERIREVSVLLAACPRRERDFISPQIAVQWPPLRVARPVVHSAQLAVALGAVFARRQTPYKVFREAISLREVMSNVLRFLLLKSGAINFWELVKSHRRAGIIFTAILQLAMENAVTLRQKNSDAPLLVGGGEKNGDP